MKRKFICLLITAVMLLTFMPITANAANHSFSLGVKTADVYLAGTDSTVYAGFRFYNGLVLSEKCDRSGDDNERNDFRWYDFTRDSPSPWMIQDVFAELDGGNDWLCEYVDIRLPYVNGSLNTTSVGKVDYNSWMEGKGKWYQNISSMTQRKITNYSGVDTWGGTFYLDANSKTAMQYSWNRTITDQYGTYNAMLYDDPPVMNYSLSNSAVGTGWFSFTEPTATQNAALSINQKLLYEAMGNVENGAHQGIGTLTLTVRLGFPQRSTNDSVSGLTSMRIGNGDYYGKVMTFTFYRSCFQLGNASISQTQTFSPRTDFNYLNRAYTNVTITLNPTSIHCGDISSQEKVNLVNNFQCTPALYLGNNTSDKLCDMTMTKSGGTLIFQGQVPMDKSGSLNDGVRLQLDNVSSFNNSKTYLLESGSSSQSFYFSTHKVDTKAPAIRLTDVNGTEISIQNAIQSQHNFYLVSSETLYPQENSLHTEANQRYIRYELFQKNGETYGTAPVAITGYLGSGSQTQVQAPVNTTVLKEAMIRLMPANPTEGQYKLRIYGWDDANNGLNGGNYHEIENIYLDRQAPRVAVTEDIQNQAEDGTKRNDYTFAITDLQNSRQYGSWARTYYCFTADGQPMPDPAQQNIEAATGEMETILGKWAFIEGGTETTTAVIKIQRGETFEGKLYYYTVDSSGNDSRNEQGGACFTKEIRIYNFDSRDTLITEQYTYPKDSYSIRFEQTDNNYRTEYRWISHDDSSFRQDFRPYTGAEEVGAGEQTGADGKSYLLDGTYTLEYKVTEQRSGNWRKYTKDYVFDNKGPQIKTRWLTGNASLLQTQQLKLDVEDVSGVESAEYTIVNTDGTPIDGYAATPITITVSADNRGTVNDTLTLSLPVNGVYALKIKATDNNGRESSVQTPAFGIRNEKPQITNITHHLNVLADGHGATADGDYQLTLNVTELLKNAASLQSEQDVRYSISTNGSDYGEWVTAENVERASGSGSINYTIYLDTPFSLAEGWNTLYIKTACVNSGVLDDPRNAVVSDACSIRLLYDNRPPVFELPVYNTTTWTNEDVTAVITASDSGTGVCILESQNEAVEISAYQNGQFTVTIKKNVTANLELSDSLGNKTLVPIAVQNIDKVAPSLEAVSEIRPSGARTDGKIEITVTDETDVQASFALVKDPDSGHSLTEADYLAFDNASTVFVDERDTMFNDEGQKVKKYTIWLRGLDGTYAIGMKATDKIGHTAEKLFADHALPITDAQPEIVQMTCDPMVTKSTATVKLQFNVPLVVLPNAPAGLSRMSDTEKETILTPAALDAQDEYVTEYSVVCHNADTISLFVKDECRRTAVLTFTPDAAFVEGFEIISSIEKNGGVIPNGGFISFLPEDTLYYIVTTSDKYQGQYLHLENAVYSGMQLNEQRSVVDAVYSDSFGTIAYSSLCFEALHDGKTTKSVRFSSYTLEGNEEDRLEEEYAAISVVDETLPVGIVKYSETKPTQQNVYATITMVDSESGIVKCEKSYDGGNTYVDTGVTAEYIEEFTGNASVIFRLTNGAGMTGFVTVTVGNIDRTTVVEDTHYTVEYTYENYLGEWVPVAQGKAYRRVMAAIRPVPGSGKVLSTTNNGGSLVKILTAGNSSFTFAITDEAGNTTHRDVEYTLFDNQPGTTAWVLSNTRKTNQNIFATLTITDESGEIAFVEVKKDGTVYPFTEEPLEGEYVVELDSSGAYHVTAYDGAGNSWTEIITVSNIDKTPPRVLTKLYSTPIGTITAKSVRVEMTEFNKNISTIRITDVEPVSGVTDQDIMYTPGEKAIRFMKNGSVSVRFVDEYGNEGMEIITVSNIYTNPPAVEATATLAADELSVKVTFDKLLDTDGVPVDPYRELSDLMVTYKGITYHLSNAEFTLKNNGEYSFFVHDSSGATQKILLSVTGIDDRAPVVKEIRWEYKYRQESQNGMWEEKAVSRTIVPGTDTTGRESGYRVAADENNPETNQNVNVTVTTDKETTFVGGKDAYSLKKSIEYRENGLFNFNLQARNRTSATYGVDIGLIDKTPPVITLENGPELIFIEGMSKVKDPMYAYDKAKLMDFHAYDMKNGVKVDLTDKVKISYGVQGRVFDPDNINHNEFVRSNPYYVDYTVYDAAGNGTTVRRTIRLVGFYDTVALVNGKMPDSTNVATVSGSSIQVSLKNFSGVSYARYEKGIFTQGQMKTRGTALTERDGLYTIDKAAEGWYTVYIQTDKRDYFNILVYVVPQTVNKQEVSK